MLAIPRYIDANTLNEKFYKELLYILGLRQVEQGNKVLIKPSDTANTLLDSINRAFGDKFSSDTNNTTKSDTNDINDAFDSHIFPLLTLWNNRLLFLRLLESMLLNFKHLEKPFLHTDTLRDFSDIATLFFKVLAVKKRESIPQNLAQIPYLNSSLFEKSALENQGYEIALLESKPLKIAQDSILRRDENLHNRYIKHNRDEALPLLEYLFAFLHAYNFTTTPRDIVDFAKTNHDKLINSAVLGLVFEKLNGYKEGSFYTPSFITSYMCQQSIRKVVVQKFNENGYKAQNLTALRNEIDINKLNEANKIFLSIHICDPAVGSGHFLVSALNELIAIKYELGLLLDAQGRVLKDIHLSLENDELIIRDSQGKIIDYTIPAHENIESHIIQKAIFTTKKELIENCLFGVDINPNSVEICKLRLWIELLKYSYYENLESRDLQTLPNIDINIKCGNSLISRFSLQDSLTHIPNIAHKIAEYQKLVSAYKNADSSPIKIHKRDIESKINALKETFRLTLKDPKTKASLERAITEHITLYGNFLLDNESLLDGLEKQTPNLFGSENLSEEAQEKAFESFGRIKFLRHKLDSALSGESYKGAFEWRFEFPEVLDSNGDFMGFDLIIGNPPYIRQEAIKELKPHFAKAFSIFTSTADIFTYFYEQGFKMLKPHGILSLITSNKFCRAGYGANLRRFLLQNTLLDFIDLNGIKVFDKATVDTCIVNLRKAKPIKSHTINYLNPKDKDLSNLTYTQISQNALTKEAFIFGDSALFELKSKIEKIGTPLKEWDIAINYGIKTGYNEAFIIDSATKDEILSNCDDSDKSRKAFYVPSLRPLPSANRGNPQSKICHSEGAHSATEESKNSHCHTELSQESEVSQNIEKRDISLNAQYDNVDISAFSKPQYDKEIDCYADKSARNDKENSPSRAEGARGWVNSHKNDNIAMLTERERTANLIKPILRGRDIKRYSYEWAGLWIIGTFPALNLNIDDYPALKNYLENFMPRIAQSGEKGCRKKTSNKWFETQDNIAYYKDFEKEKIVWNRISSELCFCYDNQKIFIADSMFIITCNSSFETKYLIGVLNSSLSKHWIKQNAATLGDGTYGAKIYIEKIPIPKITKENQQIADEIVNLVDKILAIKSSLDKNPQDSRGNPQTKPCHTEGNARSISKHKNRDISFSTKTQYDKTISVLESKIDDLVYKLYDLDSREIKIIES